MSVTLVAGEDRFAYEALSITEGLLKKIVPLASGGLIKKSNNAIVIPDAAGTLHLQNGEEYIIVKLDPGT
jgi:hypothetical protein